MYLTNYSPRALIGAFSVTTEAGMRNQQTLGLVEQGNLLSPSLACQFEIDRHHNSKGFIRQITANG